MPYCETFVTPQQIYIGIWQLTETLDELITLWGKDDYPQHFIDARADKRRCEILATALLLRNLIGDDVELRHAPNGCPIIDSGYISISHTATHVAVALHATRMVGVDIETIGNRAVRVAPRFMSPEELAHLPQEDSSIIDNTTPRTATIHITWSVKEAVYKVFPTAIEFRRDIILSPIQALPSGSVDVLLHNNSTCIEAHYTLYKGCSLAWVVR